MKVYVVMEQDRVSLHQRLVIIYTSQEDAVKHAYRLSNSTYAYYVDTYTVQDKYEG